MTEIVFQVVAPTAYREFIPVHPQDILSISEGYVIERPIATNSVSNTERNPFNCPCSSNPLTEFPQTPETSARTRRRPASFESGCHSESNAPRTDFWALLFPLLAAILSFPFSFDDWVIDSQPLTASASSQNGPRPGPGYQSGQGRVHLRRRCLHPEIDRLCRCFCYTRERLIRLVSRSDSRMVSTR